MTSFIEAVRAYDAAHKPPPVVPTGPAQAPGQATGYAQAALNSEYAALAATPPGQINDRLNIAALKLGQLVGSGHLDRRHVEDALVEAATTAYKGKTAGEGIESTIRSGMTAGMAQPRQVPPRPSSPPVTTVDGQKFGHVRSETSWSKAGQTDESTEGFWSARPVLAHVHDFARARMVSPWAMLGVVLARVITAVPPFVVLPPIVGSEASLNLFVALTGPSGAGKGAAESAGADAIDLRHRNITVATVGSGEGIAHLYAHREKGEVVRDRDAVLFTVPEVDNLTSLGIRKGATLLPQLRMAWTGEQLGFSYAAADKALPIARHTYRMGLILGVQPGRAASLLDDSDGGTPQRFVWLPTTDPDAPDVPPACPEPLSWSPQWRWATTDSRGLVVLSVPTVARDTIIAARRDRLRGDGDALDGHALLARLKVATALALLDERQAVDLEDWEIASTVMRVSDATRSAVVRHLAARALDANRARGEAEADRAVVVTEKVHTEQVRRVAGVILRALRRREGDGWATRRDLATAVAGRDRGVVDEAIAVQVDAGQIETDNATEKALYRVREGR